MKKAGVQQVQVFVGKVQVAHLHQQLPSRFQICEELIGLVHWHSFEKVLEG